jgi:hypothetical protein
MPLEEMVQRTAEKVQPNKVEGLQVQVNQDKPPNLDR